MSSVTSAGSGYGCKPSPLSQPNSDTSMETTDSLETEAGLTMRPSSRRPTKKSTGDSWSYSDDIRMFPILHIPKKEKCAEHKIINWKEQDDEVEVEVHQPLKGSPSSLARSSARVVAPLPALSCHIASHLIPTLLHHDSRGFAIPPAL